MVEMKTDTPHCVEVTYPGRTPTLLEQIAYKGLSSTALCTKMRQEREQAARYRKGVKVERVKPVNTDNWAKPANMAPDANDYLLPAKEVLS